MDTGGNGAPSYPDDSTQQSSTPAQRNPEATTVSPEVHTPSSTCGPSTTSSGASSLESESRRRKPLSPLSEFLTLPNIPPTSKSSKPKKNSGARVLTSADAIAMMEEKQRKKREEEEAKEQRKREREEKKLQKEEEK